MPGQTIRRNVRAAFMAFAGLGMLLWLIPSCTREEATGNPSTAASVENRPAGTENENAAADRLAKVVVQLNLENIDVFLRAVVLLENSRIPETERSLRASLIAELKVAATNQLIFPERAAILKTNEAFLAASEWRSRLGAVAVGELEKEGLADSPRKSSADLASLVRDLEGTDFINDIAEVAVRNNLTGIKTFYSLVRNAEAGDVVGLTRRLPNLLQAELTVAETHIEAFPQFASLITSNQSWQNAKRWRENRSGNR